MRSISLVFINLTLLLATLFGSAASSPDLIIADGEVGHARCANAEARAYASQVDAGAIAIACLAPAQPSPTATVAPTLTPSPTTTPTSSPTSVPATATPTAPPQLHSPVRLGAFLDRLSDGSGAASAVPALSWHSGNFGKDQRAFAAALDAAGYDGDHLTYVLAFQAQNGALAKYAPWPNQWSYLPTDWAYLNQRESWFLHVKRTDGTLARIYHGDGMYSMDPCSLEYRSWVYARAKMMHRAGLLADGLMLDNLPLSLALQTRIANSSAIAGGSGQPLDEERFLGCAVQFVAGLDQALGGELPIWANLIEGRSTGFEANVYFTQAGLDGAYFEQMWTGWPQFGARWSVGRQNGDMRQAEWIIANGYGLHASSQGEQTDLDTQQFALASWLQIVPAGNDGRVTFRYADARNYETLPRYPNYTIPCGEPIGDRYPVAGGFERKFQGCVVRVDQVVRRGYIEVLTP